MIKSMTGFGRYELTSDERKICIEMKSVNHRYFDLNIKMPKKLLAFENKIRAEVKKYVLRGKVDIFITYEDISKGAVRLAYNSNLAEEYMKIAEIMEKQFQMENDMTVSKLSRLPEVILMEDEDVDEEKLWPYIKEVLDRACEKFLESRQEEGERLKADLFEKLENVSENVDFIVKRSPELVAEFRQRLEEKVKELLSGTQIDDNRIALETTLYADKMSVDEEVVRLISHVAGMKNAISNGIDVGRKLDFIAQEMNREANTILSKSTDVEISDKAIELKTDIEKIREQVQNIE